MNYTLLRNILDTMHEFNTFQGDHLAVTLSKHTNFQTNVCYIGIILQPNLLQKI